MSLSTPRFGGALALLVVAALALLLPGLSAAPFERAEIYFLDAARAMAETGEWLVPHYRGEPFFDKPALTYWLMALAFELLGFDPGAARLVPVVATLGTLFATAWLGTLLFDRRTALVGTTVLVTTLAFVAFGRVAMSDMLLTLWSTLSVALGVSALRDDGRSASRALPLLGATLGLGFLTKGPVAVLLPGLGLVALAATRGRDALRALAPLPVALAALGFAVTGLGWFALLYLRLGPEPLSFFFLHENLERFAGATYDAGQPAWFYLPVYLAEAFPWSPFLPLAFLARHRTRASWLLALWLGLMLVPLSLSRGKIDYYLLPLYPAASLLVARVFVGGPWAGLERGWTRGVLGTLAVALSLLALAPTPLPDEWLPSPTWVWTLRLLAILGAVVALLVARRPTAQPTLALLALAPATLFALLAGGFLPAFRAAQPNAAIVEDVARELRYVPDASVVLCEDPTRAQRDILFHARAPVLERCDLWNYASSEYPYLLLLDPRERQALSTLPYWREVDSYRGLPARALTARYLVDFPQPESVVLMANFETADPVATRKVLKERRRALRALDRLGLPHPEPE